MINAPYYVALIEIDSGPVIEAVSAGDLAEVDVSPGDRVRLTLETLGRDEDGEEIAAYRFSTDVTLEVTK